MQLAKIFIYPVKSCGGIAVPRAALTPRGLAGDRRWMVVDESGAFFTQRTVSELGGVHAQLAGDDMFELTAAGHAPLRLPFVSSAGERLRVKVWSDEVTATRHADGSAWFTSVLGRAAQLVCMPDDTRRPVSARYAQPDDIVSFADAFPYLIVSSETIDEVCRVAGLPSDVRRFRPNLVIGGATPFAEDTWATLSIGGITFRQPKGCDRCVMTTVDPDTLARSKEPLASLATYRRRSDGNVYVAMNAIADAPGTVALGDEVRVLSTQVPPA